MDERSSDSDLHPVISEKFQEYVNKFLNGESTIEDFLGKLRRICRNQEDGYTEGDVRAAEIIVTAIIEEGGMTLADFINGSLPDYDIYFN